MEKCWCGNESLQEYSEDYYVCTKCGTLVTKKDIDESIYEIIDEDNDLYGKNYWEKKMVELSGETSVDGLIQQYLGGRVIYWMKYILKYIPIECSVAEVGCGLGQLAYLMKTIGYQQKAYEISPDICRFLRREMGLDVVCGEMGCVNEIYEAILNFDLLEHLKEPQLFVEECSQRLWGKGIFCCQTPCYNEEWSYEEMLINRPEFKNLLVPEQHIYIFSKRSITKLLYDAGFLYVNFETPAFGENYDMFLFASKEKIEMLSDEEVKKELSNTQNGRIIRVLLDFFDRLSS